MKTFEEYQALAVKVPLPLRNDRARIDLPILGLQEEVGKISSLLGQAFASGKLRLSQTQSVKVKEGLSDILWCVALLCGETGIEMQEVAAYSIARLEERTKGLDSGRR
jgi:hypothetical protein